MSEPFTPLKAASAWITSFAMHGPAAASMPAQITNDVVLQALRHAQVELYCGHDQGALTALRQVRETLAAPERHGEDLRAQLSVEEAAWHIRRHEAEQAQAAIAHARDRLA
jgi:hypothetical protein